MGRGRKLQFSYRQLQNFPTKKIIGAKISILFLNLSKMGELFLNLCIFGKKTTKNFFSSNCCPCRNVVDSKVRR